ncbi:MAG: hypothetical protein ACLP1D_13285 [Xanthobacteraceae bacterium]
MSYIALFFAGALLCNCIPHLCAGLMGKPFPTPFATPRGVGNSSPPVNFLWGAFNVGAGVALLSLRPVTIGANLDCLALAAGVLLLGAYLSRHFGKVMGDRGQA